MPTVTQRTSEAQLNQLNAQLRGEDWYQQWFQARGLNPNQVRLNDRQRADLARTAAAHGYQLGDRMKIDDAGNLNQKGGYAGLPTWGKIAVGAAPIAATAGFGAAGMGPLAGLFGSGGGVGAAGLGPGLNAAAAGGAAHGAYGATLGSGAFLPIAGAAGAAIPTARDLLNDIPTLGSTPIGTGMGTGPTDLGRGAWNAASGAYGAGSGFLGTVGEVAKGALDGGAPSWLGPVMAALAGLPGLMADHGPSDEENAYQAQATRLLHQQERRTSFQDPLYSAITKMAYGLQPVMGTGGHPYPYNSLEDVQMPGRT